MGRIGRILASAIVRSLAAGAVLCCAAVVVLWVRSQAGEDARSFRLTGGGGAAVGARYRLRSAGGRLTLLAPPPEGSGADAAGVRAWVTELRNPPLWMVEQAPGEPPDTLDYVAPATLFDFRFPYDQLHYDPARAAERQFSISARRPLLDALEDPRRWEAAHVVLSRLETRGTTCSTINRGTTFVAPGFRLPAAPEFDGLHVRHDPSRGPRPFAADPADQPAMIDRWHRALDVEVAHVPHAMAAAALGMWPAGWLLVALRRQRRRRSRLAAGRCPACGYDCRATRSRCPECGCDGRSPPRGL